MLFRFLRSRLSPISPAFGAFHFLETGTLRDGELELIPPSAAWVWALMLASRHPDTNRLSPDLAGTTERQIHDFLAICPGGRQRADAAAGNVPSYHFWMRDWSSPDLPIAGAVTLRIGAGPEVELYYGHLGYHVFPMHRGRHFAGRSVRLLLPLARRHGMDPLWITCNPDNLASRRTCQWAGGELVNIIRVPPEHSLAVRGEHFKCRYRFAMGG